LILSPILSPALRVNSPAQATGLHQTRARLVHRLASSLTRFALHLRIAGGGKESFYNQAPYQHEMTSHWRKLHLVTGNRLYR
jgi:hypothetical protein